MEETSISNLQRSKEKPSGVPAPQQTSLHPFHHKPRAVSPTYHVPTGLKTQQHRKMGTWGSPRQSLTANTSCSQALQQDSSQCLSKAQLSAIKTFVKEDLTQHCEVFCQTDLAQCFLKFYEMATPKSNSIMLPWL